ncbi:hypothetical protein [Streptomyces sp. NPDC101206]|uniref:hypothetical protein n=1 Tax=Streptomyces sp. NPDC101206 TaxID=3366128 RepID=UPI00380C3F84
MESEAPYAVGGQRQVEELLSAASLTHAQLARAVGRFNGDSGAMLNKSVRAAERAFSELDAYDEVIDTASNTGQTVTAQLRDLLTAEAPADIPAHLDALDTAAGTVRATDGPRALLNRILGVEDTAGGTPSTVRSLNWQDLPALPSAYGDEEAPLDNLLAFAARGEELQPRLREAHRARIEQVAAHLVDVVRQAAEAGFADEGFARASLHEARQAYALWLRCLEERRRDLGDGASA